jgi:hypothetical protein
MSAHYFLGSKLLGSSTSEFPSGQSCALFCTTCGDIWGRIVVSTAWRVRSVPCIKHKRTGVADWSSESGSFLVPSFDREHTSIMFAAETIEELPPEVLQYEFQLRLRQFNKEEVNGD